MTPTKKQIAWKNRRFKFLDELRTNFRPPRGCIGDSLVVYPDGTRVQRYQNTKLERILITCVCGEPMMVVETSVPPPNPEDEKKQLQCISCLRKTTVLLPSMQLPPANP